jgi:hypothetical protein
MENSIKNIFYFLLLTMLIYHAGCKHSTQSESTVISPTVTMKTDSLQYIRSMGSANVIMRIENKTDSTIVIPTCIGISKRIDLKQGNIWSIGSAEWNLPCQAIFIPDGSIEKDAFYGESLHFDTVGTFRIVTIYGSSRGTYTDTLFSNEFTVL